MLVELEAEEMRTELLLHSIAYCETGLLGGKTWAARGDIVRGCSVGNAGSLWCSARCSSSRKPWHNSSCCAPAADASRLCRCSAAAAAVTGTLVTVCYLCCLLILRADAWSHNHHHLCFHVKSHVHAQTRQAELNVALAGLLDVSLFFGLITVIQ